MIKKIFYIGLFATSTLSNGQNLVPNPSFETYQSCNFSQGDADYANGWNKSPVFNQPPSHADYCNSCSPSYGVPLNPWGSQSAATGNGYMAITTKVPAWGQYRENIYAQLITPLSIGVTYSLSFKLSLCDNFMLASNKMGLKFSMFPNISVNNSAHLFAANPVTNQSGWTVISGTFTADSAYSYIGVGNFFDDANTLEIIACSSCSQYYNIYYVDDISVTPLASPPVGPQSYFTYTGTYCEGSIVNFTDSSSNSPNSWAWSVSPAAGANISNPAAQHASIQFSQPGIYTVGLQASNSASAGTIYSSTIQIHPNPVLSLSSNVSHACAGAPVQLMASGANSYTWSNGQTGGNITVFPQQSGFYQVTGTSIYGCTSQDSIFMVVRPVPVLNISATPSLLCFGNNTQIQASGAQSYTWQPGNNSNNPVTVNPFTTTVYTVTGTNMFGCTASGTSTIVVFECVSVDELDSGTIHFAIYPNPIQNKEFTVHSSGKGQLIIYDMSGKVIQSFELFEPHHRIVVSALSPGLYQFQLLGDGSSSSLRILVD